LHAAHRETHRCSTLRRDRDRATRTRYGIEASGRRRGVGRERQRWERIGARGHGTENDDNAWSGGADPWELDDKNGRR
jgi:hypothetical protein